MATKTKDYYKILQVKPEDDAKTIQLSYRNLCKQYHPDLNPTRQAEERMKLLNEAYAVLSDPDRRTTYDAGRITATTTRRTTSTRTATATTTSSSTASTATKTRVSARPKQRKDWLDDDYAYPRHSNPTHEVRNSQRDFSAANPRARDYKFKSVTAIGRQLEQALLTYGPLDAWWLAKHVSNTHTVGLISKSEAIQALLAGQGKIFKIAWTDGGKPVWDLIV